ncbi:MAG: glycosyltransferase, partial [Acholeplasmatales bacterium]|nr:glycosyltransferase [Acholeplasmatales bacterium]
MDVMVLCPLYNAENYLYQLHDSLLMQKGIDNLKINYILTESTDKTESILKELNANYFKITKEEFSH